MLGWLELTKGMEGFFEGKLKKFKMYLHLLFYKMGQLKNFVGDESLNLRLDLISIMTSNHLELFFHHEIKQ